MVKTLVILIVILVFIHPQKIREYPRCIGMYLPGPPPEETFLPSTDDQS